MFFFMGLINACAVHRTAGGKPQTELDVESLPADYFAEQSACIRDWGAIIAEWRRNGGGVKDSIAATREQIALDDRSKFASFVRRIWSAQAHEQTRTVADLGAWPIGADESRQLSGTVASTLDPSLPEECQSLDWLDGFLWQEIVSVREGKVTARLLKETPEDMKWTSPYAQQWLSYWLLVRLE